MYNVFGVYNGVMEMMSWQSSEILEYPYSKITKAPSLGSSNKKKLLVSKEDFVK